MVADERFKAFTTKIKVNIHHFYLSACVMDNNAGFFVCLRFFYFVAEKMGMSPNVLPKTITLHQKRNFLSFVSLNRHFETKTAYC